MKLQIDDKAAVLLPDISNYYHLGSTDHALGNILALLYDEFQEDISDYMISPGDAIAKRVIMDLQSNKPPKSMTIWGLNIPVSHIHSLIDFFEMEKGDCIPLNMKTVEEFRIDHQITTVYFPNDKSQIESGIHFDVHDVKSLIYGLMYYYAMNDYKLKKCEHCGKWFATKSFKIKYCQRNSPVDKFTHLKCEQAVRNIKQEINRTKKLVYNSLTTYTQNYGDEEINRFLDKCAEYSKLGNNYKNLSEYYTFVKRYRKEQKHGNNNEKNK